MVSGLVINELPKWLVFGAWMIINVSLFIYQFNLFQTSPNFFYMRIRTREALAFARGPAIVIHFNIILILLPVCRNLISLIRGTGRCPPRTVKRILDKNLTFHKAIAWMIIASSAMHVIAHWYNYERLLGLNELPSYIYEFVPDGAQPPLPTVQPDPVTICFVTAAGITGHIITVALFLIITSSVEFIRRSFFEIFWYTHHLFIVFLLGLAFHQYQQLLPVQTNSALETFENGTVVGHPPEVCSVDPGQEACPSGAEFIAARPTSWAYMLPGLIIYIIERLIRFVRSVQRVAVIKVIKHPSKTIEIQMKKKGFFAEAGQYIFVNVPSVAWFEWHPFTLTSAPEEDYFSIHVRLVGDWTDELARQLGGEDGQFKQAWELPRIAIDGPFGTASEDVFEHEVGMLVGAGIGVTPFASVLKSVFYKLTQGNTTLHLKKLYFFWICPEPTAFEWFADLLTSVEQQMSENGKSDFLDIHIYLTRGLKDKDAFAVYLQEGEERDAITGLQAKTHFGRPDWARLFDDISLAHPKTAVGVFFCGPSVLSHNLHKFCNEYTGKGDNNRARFYYNKENF